MARLHVMTAQEQVANHLRACILQGDWVGVMPGGDRLAEELGVGKETVETALKQLEHEGLIVAQGKGRGRLIRLPGENSMERKLRIGFLLHTRDDFQSVYFNRIRHELEMAGQRVVVAPRTATDLKMDESRIARMVEKSQVHAWVVVNGARELLEWFAASRLDAFAMLGRRYGLPMAGIGPNKADAIHEATRRLIQCGHRRIAYLARPWRRLPGPGAPEQAFLEALLAHGIQTSPYHLPEWEESVDGFHYRLVEMFRITPPSALIIEETPLFVAAQQFLSKKRLRVPEDVSLVCANFDPLYDWCRPRLARIQWDDNLLVKRVIEWVGHVAAGREDKRNTSIPAEFIAGETLGACAT